MRVGPEPTTDRFIVVSHGKDETILPGYSLAVDANKQFYPLSKFGNTFLNRYGTIHAHLAAKTLFHRFLLLFIQISVLGLRLGRSPRYHHD